MGDKKDKAAVLSGEQKIVSVKLTQCKEGFAFIERESTETRLFSSMDKAEKWLHDNGFVYKHFDFLKEGVEVWGHKTNQSWSFVEVEIDTYDVDSDETYTPDDPGVAPWIQAAREEAMVEGMKAGIEDGKKAAEEKFLVSFVRNNGYPIEQAAEVLNKSVEECENMLKEIDLRKQSEKEKEDTNDKH